MADFPAVLASIQKALTFPFSDRQKAGLIFQLATAHDPCEPLDLAFVPTDHPLWAAFVPDMLGLGNASSFESIANIIDPWRKRFYESDEFLDRERKKRGRSSPKNDDGPHKYRRMDESVPQDVPPLPPYSHVDYDTVSGGVKEILDAFEANLTAPNGLLHPDTKNVFPETEFWKPAAEWTPTSPLASAVAAHVARMKIPCVPCNTGPAQPDMLLYAFGSFRSVDPEFGKRLEGAGLRSSRSMINNTSGSGKSKLLHDYLCTCWGFLFTCFYDKQTNPYGSEDVYSVFHMLEDKRRRAPNGAFFITKVIVDQRDTRSAQSQFDSWQNIWESNTFIATHLFTLVLLARLLVYERFRQTVAKHRVDLNRAMRAWALLQVCPHLSGLDDIFLVLFRHISLVSKADAAAQVTRLVKDLKTKRWSPQFFAFDEAQAASTAFDTCFGPNFNADDDSSMPGIDKPLRQLFLECIRPVLKPLVQAMHARFPKARICVSGTKMSSEVINEALMSSIAKQSGLLEVLQLGGHNTSTSIAGTLAHFFGAEFSSAIQSMRIWKDIVYWLQGRHRFLAIFIQAILIIGSVEETTLMHLLNEIVSVLSDHDLRVEGAPEFDFLNYRSILPKALRKPLLPRIISEPENYRPDVVRTVLDCIISFLLTAEYPDYPAEDLTLVELGIGRFDKPAVGKEKKGIRVLVNENIVLLMLLRWLDRKDGNGLSPLQLHLRSAMSTPQASPKGFAFEDLIIYLLWNWFSDDGARLSDIFTFHSPKPSWADERVQLISMSDSSIHPPVVSKDTTTGLAIQTSDGPSTMQALVSDASLSPNEHGYQFRRPFLKPDVRFGPDALFALRFADGTRLLVCVQCKCWAKSADVHKGEEIEEIMWKLAPEGWYGGKPNAKVKVDLENLEQRFPRVPLDFPEPTDGSPTVEGIDYRAYPVQTAVLRVFAALRGTYELPDTITSKQFGCYPIVTFSDNAVHDGAMRFSSFKRVVDTALEREEKRRAASAAKQKVTTISAPSQAQASSSKPATRRTKSKKAEDNAVAASSTPKKKPKPKAGSRRKRGDDMDVD